MSFLETAELASYLVTVIGLPLAILVFIHEQRKECRRQGYNGVVCGHIHHAEIRNMEGVTYHNCGDWVESCTALAEDFNGRIRILRVSSEASQADHPRVTSLPRTASRATGAA